MKRTTFISSAIVSILVVLAGCEKAPPEPAPSQSAARETPAATAQPSAATPQPSAAASTDPRVVGTIAMSELGPLQDKKALPAPADVAAAPNDAKKTASGLARKVLTPGTGKERPGP